MTNESQPPTPSEVVTPPMNADRDELAEMIRTHLYDDNTDCRVAADAVIAAGWNRRTAASLPDTPLTEELGWLLENHSGGVASWLSGFELHQRGHREFASAYLQPLLTEDSLKAIRFARMEDALAVLQQLDVPWQHGALKPSEHMWTDAGRVAAPSSAPPTQEPVAWAVLNADGKVPFVHLERLVVEGEAEAIADKESRPTVALALGFLSPERYVTNANK